jgi:predicted SAM-dependent methyltransferase
MAHQSSPQRWNWEDPDEFSKRRAEVDVARGRCHLLELATTAAPLFTRPDLADIGLTGIEFGTLRTKHGSGLAADVVGLRSSDTRTERGRVYRVDGESYFTEIDVADPLPFEADCVDWVYAEHLIEHVKLATAIGWLKEVRRILSQGGLLRVTTPDLRKYAECYVRDDGFFSEHRSRMDSVAMPARRAFMVNQIFFLYGHRWIYDVEELRHALSEAGFAAGKITPRAFREGALREVAQLDRPFRSDETIYMEAIA